MRRPNPYVDCLILGATCQAFAGGAGDAGAEHGEVEELEAEAVVGTCISFIEQVVELWQRWPVDLQNRLQVMVLPEGVGYDVLEGLSNPKLSLVYAVFENSTTMAAPSRDDSNFLFLHELNLPSLEISRILKSN